MKRILMLNYEFPPLGGGAANATFYLLKEFAKRSDVEIDLVTSSVDGFRIEDFAPNVRIHYLDIGKRGNLHYQSMRDLLAYSWRAYRYGRKLMTERKYDLCHAFFGIPCGYIAMKLGLPYIVSLRGSDVPFHNKKFHWLDKLVFRRLSRKIWRRAGRVAANSEKLSDLALASAWRPDSWRLASSLGSKGGVGLRIRTRCSVPWSVMRHINIGETARLTKMRFFFGETLR